MNELTICSVYHSAVSKRFLELNYELTHKLNSRRDWTWLVADNTPKDFTDKIDEKKFQVVPAMPFAEFVQKLEPWQQAIRASLHHSHAVNLSLPHVKTRFALVLDSDFYIVQKEWIEKVLSHMKENKIAIMGVPWHPRWWKKVRYFPAHHAFFVDTHQVPLSDLDFRPQYKSDNELPRETKAFFKFLAGRRMIGSSKDTSYAIYKKFYNSGIRVETLKPFYKYPVPKRLTRRIGRALAELLLPDSLSYNPRRDSYSTQSFESRGYFNAAGEGWEEFFWQEKPFGFHVRGNPGGAARNKEEELRRAGAAVESFKERPVE